MKELLYLSIFLLVFVHVRGRPEPPLPYNIPQPQFLSAQQEQHAQGYSLRPNLESMIKANQENQQKYLNTQYQIQQKREQEQLMKERELEEMKTEIRKQLLELENKRQEIINETPQGNQQGKFEYGASQLNVATSGYEVPVESVTQPQYGVPSKESAIPVPTPTEAVICDERKQIGPTRIFMVQTREKQICKVTLQPFDRCQGSEPIEVTYDDAGHPGACEGVTKILNTVKVVGNTAQKASSQAVRAATYAVDAYDTVKDFYKGVYWRWRQRKEQEKGESHKSEAHTGGY